MELEEGRGTNCWRKIEFTHPRYIYIRIYIYIYGYRIFFLLFFFLIRREIGQIKIRSKVRVALEFTRFLVTRGSSCVDEGSYSFFFMENFSHSTFFRKRTVN